MTSFWNRPVLRLIATDRCRVAAPWFVWTRGRDRASELRRRANALERRKLGATHPVEQAFAALLYLPLSVPRILRAVWRWGRALRITDHIPYARQCLHLCACAWRLGLRPEVYYYLRLHERRSTDVWSQVIDPSELHHLQRDISPPGHEPLEDKLLFAHRARAHGLPVVPLLQVWHRGRPSFGSASLDRDLFVKRARSYRSQGVRAFRYDPATRSHREGDRRYTRAQLYRALGRASRHATLLVQPRLRNHPDLRGFSAEALCNYRVVTGRHRNGRCELLMASLRFPLCSTVTCAEPHVTLCAAVDLATGRLHAAESKNPALGRLPRHPHSGQLIAGRPVPRWAELRALALRAHDTWPEFPFIGWDLADASAGLFLLEGSPLWGGYLAQMSGSPPLGLTSFAAIYEEHLAGRAADRP